MTMRIVVRGFLRKQMVFEECMDLDSARADAVLPALADQHASAMAQGRLGMIEIEFLDEPNPLDRFFRFGVDPEGMVLPVEIDIADL